MSSRSEAEDWAEELEAVAGRIAPRFGRAEPRRRALAYLQGLLAPLERKNGWHLAEAAGDHTPDGMQAFLARVHWDADALRDDLRAYVVEHLGDDDAVLVLDETGFLKKGAKSAGVHRQYSGTAGRIENCQIGVFLAYATRHGHALIDRALYLPKTWTDDPSRCRNAGIPDEVTFTTKPKIGRAMLDRALAAHLPFAWVTGDSGYGADSTLRRAIEATGKGYVLSVTSAQRLGLRPVEDWAKQVRKKGWTRLSAGDGAKGPRLYDWAYVPFRGAREGWQKALLIRRALEKPDELSFYLTLAPEGTELATLVQVAGARWTIEACFEAAKGEVGLDEYEVRSWTGWHRHVTLAMLAHAYLAVVRQHAIRGRGPRPRGRLAAPHGSRGAPAHLASRLGQAARPHPRARLVGLATTTPAARQTITLDPQNQNSSTPAVVLVVWRRNVVGIRCVGRLRRMLGALTVVPSPLSRGGPDAHDPSERPHHPGRPGRDCAIARANRDLGAAL
jgi:SRSO17 transposase